MRRWKGVDRMRLIDADLIIPKSLENKKIILRHYIEPNHDQIIEALFKDILEIIDAVPTVDAIPVPENATNADMLKAVFSDKEYEIFKDRMSKTLWWNAPYKRKG